MKHAVTSLVAALSLTAGAHAQSSAPVTLTWSMWSGSDEETKAWQHVADLVHQKYPNITVQLQTAPFGDYWTKLPTLAATNQLPDIVSVQSLRLAGAANLLVPLDTLAQSTAGFNLKDFDPAALSIMKSGGKLYGLPYDFGAWVVFYNADLFKKYNVPLPKPGWTQADFVKAAQALTRDGKYGYGVSTQDWLNYVAPAGAKYIVNDRLNLTDPAVVSTVQSYVDLTAKLKVAPAIPSTDVYNFIQGRFMSGNIAMYMDGPWASINLRDNAKFKLGMATVPAGRAGSVGLVAGSGFGVSRSSKNAAAAWQAVQVLTGQEAEQYLASTGRAFSSRSAQQQAWYDNAKIDTAKATLGYTLKHSVPYATTLNWNTVSSLMDQYLPLAINGSQTASQVLETIQKLGSR